MTAARRIFIRPKGERQPLPLKYQPATNAELQRLTRNWRRVDVGKSDVHRHKGDHYIT